MWRFFFLLFDFTKSTFLWITKLFSSKAIFLGVFLIIVHEKFSDNTMVLFEGIASLISLNHWLNLFLKILERICALPPNSLRLSEVQSLLEFTRRNLGITTAFNFMKYSAKLYVRVQTYRSKRSCIRSPTKMSATNFIKEK